MVHDIAIVTMGD